MKIPLFSGHLRTELRMELRQLRQSRLLSIATNGVSHCKKRTCRGDEIGKHRGLKILSGSFLLLGRRGRNPFQHHDLPALQEGDPKLLKRRFLRFNCGIICGSITGLPQGLPQLILAP